MAQTGKIVAQLLNGILRCYNCRRRDVVYRALWIGPASSVRPAESTAAKSAPATMTAPEQAPTPIEQVRALAETIAGPEPAPAPQSPAQQILSPGAPEASAPQSAEPESPPQRSEREVAAALMECVNLLAPISAQVVPLAPLR
jgi:hypothetical protein